MPKGAEYRSRVWVGRKALAHHAAGKSLANARGRKTQPPPKLEMRDIANPPGIIVLPR